VGFKSGHIKIGGRKKGVPNKRSLGFLKNLEELGLDPIKIIAENIHQLDPQRKVQASLQLLDFVYPKRKAIDLDIERNPEADASEVERLKALYIQIAKKPE
jgi:hypothetical protein